MSKTPIYPKIVKSIIVGDSYYYTIFLDVSLFGGCDIMV